MNTESSSSASSSPLNDSAPKPTNGHKYSKPYDFVRRAKSAATRLPSRLDEQVRRTPYAVLGAACLVGVGVGAVFSSRILRAIVSAMATAAALELTRAFIRDALTRADAS